MQAVQNCTVWEYEQDKTNMRILKLGYVKFLVFVSVWTVPS